MTDQLVSVSTLAAAAVTVDRESLTIESVNDPFCTTFGYERGRIVGRPAKELVPESDREGHDSLMRQWFDNPVPRLMGNARSAVRIVDSSGREKPVNIGLSPCTTGDCVVAVIVPRWHQSQIKQHGFSIIVLFIAIVMLSITSWLPELAEVKTAGAALLGMVMLYMGGALRGEPKQNNR